MNIKENVPLGEFSWWQVGGPAQYYCRPKTEEELKQALLWTQQHQTKYTVLGMGSNVLISDQGIRGLVIHMSDYVGFTVDESKERIALTALAGTPKSEALKVFIKHRLPPAVFLAGLPGDIGGGVVMNAGIGLQREPREFCEIVDSFKVLRLGEDGKVTELNFKNNEVSWSYRHCRGWQPGVISQVTLAWPNQPDDDVLKEVRAGNKRRKETQPLNMPSCGSTFKNPPGEHAGALIEKAGLKGLQIGGAQVSDKHANFIVNTGGATASDIEQVIRQVQKIVKEKFAVELTTEVVYLS